MRRAGLVVLALGLACAGGAARGQEGLRFPASTRMVQLDVRVSRNGEPLVGLTAEDFEVRDEGAAQQVELVERTAVAIRPVLLLDTSQSVAGPRLARLRAAARAFLEGLAQRDQPELMTFSHRVRLAAPLGGGRDSVYQALDRMTARGGTALFDAVYAGLTLPAPPGTRPVLVVFSDGENRLSWLTPAKVLAAARASESVVYAVQSARAARAANDPTLPVKQRQFGDAPALLQDVARETGGRVWAADAAALEQAFLDALAEIKSGYLLRYDVPAGARPGWRRVSARLRRGRGEVRVRTGYWLREVD